LADRHQLTILDADLYAREAVVVGSPILATIHDRYGPSILLPDGSLDRKALGHLIFSQPLERQWLETQIHPYVRHQLIQNRDRALLSHPHRPVFLVIPLLFEAKMTDLTPEIWVIYCPRDRQLQRLQERENLTLAQAENRIEAQLDIQIKCDRASHVLDNSTTVAGLYQQIDRLLRLEAEG